MRYYPSCLYLPRKNILPGLLTVSTAFGMSVPIQAQASAGDSAFLLEEIVVTARKREEGMQDIPIAITAFNENTLDRLGADDTLDLVARVPNLAFNGDGITVGAIGMRGIVNTARNIGFESGMGMYIDQVYVGRPAAFNQYLADVEQVEVLRGPQGTLFGRNTIAGAINITTKKATDEVEGKVKVTVGDYDTLNASAFASGPLIEDKLYGKVSAYSYDQGKGSVKNHYNGEWLNDGSVLGFRGGLRWEASDTLEINLDIDTMKERKTRVFTELNTTRLFPFSPPPFSSDIGIVEGYEGDDFPNETNQDGPTFEGRDIDGISFRVDWELDSGLTFTSLSAFKRVNFDLGNDDDSRPSPQSHTIFHDDSDSFTHEFRLQSPSDDTFDWMVGIFYLNQTSEADRGTAIGTPPFLVGLPNANGNILDNTGLLSSQSQVDTESLAIFANSNYYFSDALSLNVGLRYTDEEKELDFVQFNDTFTAHPNIITEQSSDDGAMSGNVSLMWNLAEDVSVYGTVSRGFKSAGFNPDIVPSPELAFDSETVWSYELGLKSVFADGRVMFNAALFFTDYEDLQVQRLGISATGVGFAISNAKSAEIWGLELELLARPTAGLETGISIGVLDSEYTDFDDCSGDINAIDDFNAMVFTGSEFNLNLVDCDGNQLTHAPDLTANAFVSYEHPAGDGDLSYRLEWTYKGETFAEPANFERTQVDAYDVGNIRVAYVTDNGNWETALRVDNITDEEYEGFTFLIPSYNNVFSSYNIGRTYKFDVIYKF